MTLDVELSLAAAERSVSGIERDGRPARAVTLSRAYPTTRAELWDAATNAGRIPRWFLPIDGELTLGGRYQLEGNAGGLITACEPWSHLAVDWEFGGDLSWLEVRIREDGPGRARVTLTHTSLVTEHWERYGAGATGVGWDLILLGLAMHVADPAAPKPDEIAFVTSAEGRAFIAGSSAAWAEAAIAAGEEPGAARGAAAITTAFYTGEAVEPG
jgi:uncharacterized protein YndB with AHSA1/START domain